MITSGELFVRSLGLLADFGVRDRPDDRLPWPDIM